jgi:hypothetical protein
MYVIEKLYFLSSAARRGKCEVTAKSHRGESDFD